MTPPLIAFILAVIHVSIVTLTMIAVRGCLVRRFAADRATVSLIGMVCILVVTAMAVVPLPGIWTHLNREQLTSTDPEKPLLASPTPEVPPNSPNTGSFAIVISLSTSTFERLGEGLQTTISTVDTTPSPWKKLLGGVLLCGIVVSVLQLLLSLRAVRRLHHTSVPIEDEQAISALERLRHRGGVRRPIDLRETEQLDSAATFGLVSPVILLPSIWRQWSDEELAATLAHEVAHISRGDYRQRLLARTCAAIHFYHPLVRACVGQLAIDQELAADRLAASLQTDNKAYLRGLARLALRYDNSFIEGRRWSNVSIMPRSSDFLARRLEMLRTKDGSTGKQFSRIVSCCASACVVAIAVTAMTLRSPVASAEKPEKNPLKPVQTARRITTADSVAVEEAIKQPPENLFAREPFDPSIIPNAENGAYLIRIRELLKNAEFSTQIDKWSHGLSAALRDWAKNEIAIDLRQIEWIAGDISVSHKMTKMKDGNEMAAFMFGTVSVLVHTSEPADWQQIILKQVSGATLETFQGKSYVQLPSIPALGPTSIRLRVLDDRTIEASYGDPNDKGLANFQKRLTEPQPISKAYDWADAWRAADGGLIVAVSNHEKSGYSKLPLEKQEECPPYARPLLTKVKYYALGLDLSDSGKQAAVRARATCDNQPTVAELHLSSMIALSKWPELFLDNEELLDKHQKRWLQFFSGVNVQPSDGHDNRHYLHMEVQAPLNENEAVSLLQTLFE